jgi:ABC-2 type transport system permease protein
MGRRIEEPRTAGARLRWSLRDTGTITRLYTLRSTHELDAVATNIIMPVFFILLFSYVFGSSISLPGGDYKSYLLSGMLAQGSLFAAGTVALAVATDMREGLMDRFRTMPIARTSVLLGRMLATLLVGLPGFAVMTGSAFAVGLRPTTGLSEILSAFGLIVCFFLAMCWVGALIGICASSPGAASGLTMVPTFLLAFISNVHVDTARMPTALRVVAEWNPLSAVVAAVRELLGTTGSTTVPDVVTLRYPIITTLVMTALLFAVLVPLSVRRFSIVTR